MQSEWQSFLMAESAHIAHGRVLDFGQPAQELAGAEGDVMADLSHLGLLSLSGDDAMQFLQGQSTNDLRLVDACRSQLNSHCTPKGRMLALFRVFRRNDAYYLRLPLDVLPPLQKKLRMYVLRSRVSITDASDELARFGLAGPRAEELLKDAFGEIPAALDGVITREADAITVVRISGTTARFELYGPAKSLQTLWRQFAGTARPVGSAVWSLLDIRAGIPEILPATSEAFVPQMVNLQALGGVSFQKGCYTGQEVVARMQYLGTLKRRMYLAHVDGASPQAGDELYAPEVESGQGTGKLVAAQPAPQGGHDLLAVLLISAVEAGTPIRLHDAQGPLLRFLSLPYEADILAKQGN